MLQSQCSTEIYCLSKRWVNISAVIDHHSLRWGSVGLKLCGSMTIILNMVQFLSHSYKVRVWMSHQEKQDLNQYQTTMCGPGFLVSDYSLTFVHHLCQQKLNLQCFLSDSAPLSPPGPPRLPRGLVCWGWQRLLTFSKLWRRRWRRSGLCVSGLPPLLLASFSCGIRQAAPPRLASWTAPLAVD